MVEDAVTVCIETGGGLVGLIFAVDQQIGIAIIVVVPPGDGAVGDADNALIDIGKIAAAIIAIEEGGGDKGAGVARDENIFVAVAVIVVPGNSAIAHAHDCSVGIDKGVVALIAIEDGERRATVVVPSKQ